MGIAAQRQQTRRLRSRVVGVLAVGASLAALGVPETALSDKRPVGNVVVKRVRLSTGPWRGGSPFFHTLDQRLAPPTLKFRIAKDGSFRAYTWDNKRKRGRVARHPRFAMKNIRAVGTQFCTKDGVPGTVRSPAQIEIKKIKLEPKSAGYKREGDKRQYWIYPKKPTTQAIPGGKRSIVAKGGLGIARTGRPSSRDGKIGLFITDTFAGTPTTRCEFKIAGAIQRS